MAWTTLIEPSTVVTHLGDEQWAICDCRFVLDDPDAGERAYRESHLPGARYVHLDRDLSGPRDGCSGRHPLPDPGVFAQRLGKLGIGAATQVVAYDQMGGMIAARLWWLLRWLGHDAVAVLNGGWQYWLEQGLPVDDAVAAPTPRAFTPKPTRAAWLGSAELELQLRQGDVCLIDARSGPRFRGEQEPLDPVAGHVPGACNRPCQDNLDAHGRMRSPVELRAVFSALAADPARAVHMCGSGVTACHNQLAMEVAGLSGSRLYAGSWSEWIRDPSRAVARGAGPD